MTVRYQVTVVIDGQRLRETGLTWHQACHAVQSYGAWVRGPITATVEPETKGEART